MSEGLDMSLDDIIKKNKESGREGGGSRGRGRGRGFNSGPGPGPTRRLPNRAPVRPTPYLPPQPQVIQVQEILRTGGTNPEAGTKLYISNLDYGVSNEDIKVLFSEVGDLKRYSIHYDRSGRSKGTAEVVYARQSDALAAVKRYSNLQLDGKPMKIEVVGVNLVTTAVVPPTTNGILGSHPSSEFRSVQVTGRGWNNHGGSGGRRGSGRGRGQGRSNGEKKSAEDLDAELEKYHLQAMQIN